MQNLGAMAFSSIKSQLESQLAARFGSVTRRVEKLELEPALIGVEEVDSITGGLPRGAISEFVGAGSSGRTSLLLAALAASTSRGEVCALVDTSDAFDTASAANAGVDLDQLLWVRCGSNGAHALKAADLLLQGGGFGLVALDLGDISTRDTRRIQPSWWFRFRRAIENKPTVLLVIGQQSCALSCSSLVLEVKKEDASWSAPAPDHSQPIPLSSKLLRGFQLHIERHKPIKLGKRRARLPAATAYDRSLD